MGIVEKYMLQSKEIFKKEEKGTHESKERTKDELENSD